MNSTLKDVMKLVRCRMLHIKHWQRKTTSGATWWLCMLCGQTHGLTFDKDPKSEEVDNDTKLS